MTVKIRRFTGSKCDPFYKSLGCNTYGGSSFIIKWLGMKLKTSFDNVDYPAFVSSNLSAIKCH